MYLVCFVNFFDLFTCPHNRVDWLLNQVFAMFTKLNRRRRRVMGFHRSGGCRALSCKIKIPFLARGLFLKSPSGKKPCFILKTLYSEVFLLCSVQKTLARFRPLPWFGEKPRLQWRKALTSLETKAPPFAGGSEHYAVVNGNSCRLNGFVVEVTWRGTVAGPQSKWLMPVGLVFFVWKLQNASPSNSFYAAFSSFEGCSVHFDQEKRRACAFLEKRVLSCIDTGGERKLVLLHLYVLTMCCKISNQYCSS